MLVVDPLQIVWLAGVANTSGIGLTFTVTVCTGMLGQLVAFAHTVYTTLPPAFAVLNVSAWLINPGALGAAELLAPVTPVATTVHSYCTPDTVFGFVKLIVGVPPSHTVNTVLLIAKVGVGFTVIVTSVKVPLHPFALGVIL